MEDRPWPLRFSLSRKVDLETQAPSNSRNSNCTLSVPVHRRSSERHAEKYQGAPSGVSGGETYEVILVSRWKDSEMAAAAPHSRLQKCSRSFSNASNAARSRSSSDIARQTALACRGGGVRAPQKMC